MEPTATPERKRESRFVRLKNRVKNILDRWPRLVIMLRCYLSFFALLLFSFVIGYWISKMEGPTEITINNAYMREFYITKQLPMEATKNNLIELSENCLVEYERNNYTTNNSASHIASTDLNYLRAENILLPNTDTTWEKFAGFANLTFQLPRSSFEDQSQDSTINGNETLIETTDSIGATNYSNELSIASDGLLAYAEACKGIAEELVLSILQFSIQLSAMSAYSDVKGGRDGLTFNWVRCWNESSFGLANVFRPRTQAERNASTINSQKKYFAESWEQDRELLYMYFVEESGCDTMSGEEVDYSIQESGNTTKRLSPQSECYWEAHKKSIMQATGQKGCIANVASASWFWFTVMTTVGYGNSPPNTTGGRILVLCLGWLMCILFGIIMIVHGYDMNVILDDLFRRNNMKWLEKPKYAAPAWFLVNIAYVFFVGWMAQHYWNFFVPDFTYTDFDSYWFSYITLLTVGLGDFYLQPEGLFTSDVMSWSFILLHGFTFMASGIGKFSDLIQACLPDKEESLEYHLARVDICGSGVNTPISKSLEILRDLAEQEVVGDDISSKPFSSSYRSSFTGRNDHAIAPDGHTINMHRIKILNEKKALLIRLLLHNEMELEERMSSAALKAFHSTNGDQEKGSPDVNEGDIDKGLPQISDEAFEALSISRVEGDRSLSTSVPVIATLEREEEILHSILLRTKELRNQLQDTKDKDNEHDDLDVR